MIFVFRRVLTVTEAVSHDQLLFNDFNLNRKLEQLSKKVELDLNVDVGMATVDVY